MNMVWQQLRIEVRGLLEAVIGSMGRVKKGAKA